ncbi:unnamed protein product [Heterobilharzia americana]|nr:unnamed protein product [Heterobilharzia americana]
MLFTIFALYILCRTTSCTLYSEMKGVDVLSPEVFDGKTSEGDWLVIFYRKSCGHCINYSKVFLEFSVSARNWKWALHLGSVDCEDEQNTALCIRFGIDSVPSLVFLFTTDGKQSWEEVSANKNASLLRLNVASKLLNVSSLRLPREESVNEPLTVTSNNSDINTLIILDYSLPLRRQITGAIKNEATDIVVTSSLSNLIIARGTEEEVRKVLDKMSNTLPGLQENAESELSKSTPVPGKYLPVYGVDIYRSLSMLLQLDVGARDAIEGSSLAALKEFLQMLYELLPASQEYKDYLTKISAWLNSKTSTTGREWTEFLKQIEFPIYKGPFIGCNGSKPHYRGYPCGLWTLFHALTVEQYLLASSSPANIVRPGESILPENRARPHPDEFFFDESIIPTLPKAPVTSRDSVLWLSIIHNRVNKRLAGQLSEDPTAPKIQFPPVSLCPNCWAPDSKGQLELGKTPPTEEALLQFLVQRYRASSWDYEQLPTVFITNAVELKTEQPVSDLMIISIISVVLTILAAIILLFGLRYICRGHRFYRGRRVQHTSGQTV